MSNDARRSARRDARNAELNDLEDDVVNAAEDFREDKTIPVAVRIHVLNQVKEMFHHVVLTGYSQPAALLSTPVAALGPGSSGQTTNPEITDKVDALAQLFGKSPAETLQSLITMFGFLSGTPSQEARVKLLSMGRVANDDLKVDVRSGLTDAELKRDKHKADLDTMTADRDSEKSKADTLQQQLDAALAAGDPVALKAERDTARTEKTSLQAAIDDVKSHSRPSRTKATDKVTDSAVLQGTTKTAFGWT